MTKEEEQHISDKQIKIAVDRYGFNMPRSLAESKAKRIVKDSMRSYNGSTSLSTYLSSKLKKLSRDSYKKSTPFQMSEHSIINAKKVKDFLEDYKDNHGIIPSDSIIMAKFKISKKELQKILQKTSISSIAEDTRSSSFKHVPPETKAYAFKSLSDMEKRMATDIYMNNLSSASIQKKYKIKKTKFFKEKKNIDNKIKSRFENEFINYE